MTTPCLEYRGPRTKGGYGQPTFDGVQVLLHRWIVEQVEGPLLPGEVVRHTCDNPPCFRYDHLIRGTYADNAQDAIERGHHWPTEVTECPQGHPYDEKNTYVRPKTGYRNCRACHREETRRLRNPT